MTISQKSWVKQHKKEFANKLILASGAEPNETPSGIFMAGLPGAGKTEFTKNLIVSSNLKVVRLDMDEIATHIEGYRPEIADRFRGGASELLNKTFDQTLKRRLDFIMDGTFGSSYATGNIERVLKYGYEIKIFYLVQDPKIAWDFTLAREKIEHRSIGLDGFITTYFTIQDNIRKVMEQKCDKIVVDMIVKDSTNKIVKWNRNISLDYIDKINKNCYNEKTLKETLNGE